MTHLSIIRSVHGTWTLGYLIEGKAFRDLRFSPHLSHHEAHYLLLNERRNR